MPMHRGDVPIQSGFIQLLEGSEIHWGITSTTKWGDVAYEVLCGLCRKTRWVVRPAILTSIRKKKPFTGLCRYCNSTAGLSTPPPAYPGYRHNYARFVTSSGYITLALSGLSKDDQALAVPMAQRRNNMRVAEHRLVMARHLDRPLRNNETVHHINGNRSDNQIENLRLYTGRHGRGSDGFYQEWQEAINEIERLKKILAVHGLSVRQDQ